MLVSGQAGPFQGSVAVGQAIAAASRDPDPPGPRRQPAPCTASPAAAAHRDRQHNTEGGPDRVDSGADERGAAEGGAPAIFARAAAIASQADEAVEVVDAALDHSSHRDRAGGRRITVSSSAKGKTTSVAANQDFGQRSALDVVAGRAVKMRVEKQHVSVLTKRGSEYGMQQRLLGHQAILRHAFERGRVLGSDCTLSPHCNAHCDVNLPRYSVEGS